MYNLHIKSIRQTKRQDNVGRVDRRKEEKGKTRIEESEKERQDREGKQLKYKTEKTEDKRRIEKRGKL